MRGGGGAYSLPPARSIWDGFVNLLCPRRSSGKRVPLPGPPCLLGSPLCARDLGPTRESLPHLLTVGGCGQQMPSRAELGAEVLAEALTAAWAIEDSSTRAWALGALAPQLSGNLLQ
jgi:hypothetical protein